MPHRGRSWSAWEATAVAESSSQDEIDAAMVAAAKAGRTVVRLKEAILTSSPAVPRRWRPWPRAGIDFETVPGVTAALAAAGYAGIPITHSQHASALALITGHERHDKQHSSLNYAALAGFPGTLIFYMGITSAAQWSEMLDPARPIARDAHDDRPPLHLERSGDHPLHPGAPSAGRSPSTAFVPPAIIVVGEVVGLRRGLLVRRKTAVRQTGPGYPSPRQARAGRSAGGAGGLGVDPAGDTRSGRRPTGGRSMRP